MKLFSISIRLYVEKCGGSAEDMSVGSENGGFRRRSSIKISVEKFRRWQNVVIFAKYMPYGTLILTY